METKFVTYSLMVSAIALILIISGIKLVKEITDEPYKAT